MLTTTIDKQTLMALQKKRNYHRIRELVRISFGLGVNLTSPSSFKDSLRILNVLLTAIGVVSLYGNWGLVARYFDNLPKMVEGIATAFQALMSVAKMIYYLFMQRYFYRLLKKAQTHELLLQGQLFKRELPLTPRLRHQVNDIMEGTWRNIRRQLLIYICCCSSIISYYFLVAVSVNFYHKRKQTPNYEHILPFFGFWPIWEDKGMSFPYYHIQILFSTIADYIAGMGAVSFDGLFIVLCVHSVGLMDSLYVAVLQSTSPLVPPEWRLDYLRGCIKQFQLIDEYVQEQKTIYRHISLCQFILSLVTFGIVLFQMSIGLESNKEIVLRMLMYISASAYQTISYCYNGERLTTSYEKLPLAFYSCDWYNETCEFKQLVHMMIMRSNRVFHFEISWFAPMSLATLVSMAKISVSYFLLLRNVVENQ